MSDFYTLSLRHELEHFNALLDDLVWVKLFDLTHKLLLNDLLHVQNVLHEIHQQLSQILHLLLQLETLLLVLWSAIQINQ